MENPEARGHLKERGVARSVVRSCGLGYADGHSLEMHVRKHGGLRTAEDLGLLLRSEPGDAGPGLRERFGGRIVVPELRGGQPVWVIGRAPRDGDTHVKSLSVPRERPILGFERAVGRREVYLAEGVSDVDRGGWEATERFEAVRKPLAPYRAVNGLDLNDLGGRATGWRVTMMTEPGGRKQWRLAAAFT